MHCGRKIVMTVNGNTDEKIDFKRGNCQVYTTVEHLPINLIKHPTLAKLIHNPELLIA